jgi:hypothetical protein
MAKKLVRITNRILFYFFKFIYSHVHTLFGSFLLPAPLPHAFPSVPGRYCSALITNFVEEKTQE